MRRWVGHVLVVVAALVAGCVVAYDPGGESRLGVGSPTPTRVITGPSASEAAAPRIPGVTPSARIDETATTPGARLPTIPGTPAGRQLGWVMEALNGRIEKKIKDHFDPAFLRRVPESEFRSTVQRWRRDEFGSGESQVIQILSSDDSGAEALVAGSATGRYSKLRVGVDSQGRIDALALSPAPSTSADPNATWAGFDTRLSGLHGTFALGAYELAADKPPRVVHAFGPDRPLAIGTVARLYVAGAVAEEIAAGRLKWDEIITIQDSLKSLPTGRLQLLPEGAEVRLADAFESMLSPGDNTAADHLMFRIGRDAVERYVRAHSGSAGANAPFLSTMELHKLKLSPDESLAKRYAAATEAERRSLLAPGGPVEQATINPARLEQWGEPRQVSQIEWFATSRDVAALLADLHRLAARPGLEPLARALRLNPVVPFDARPWKSIVYAGGSEPGVLSLAWLLQRADGRWHVLTLTWNDPERPVDAGTLSELAAAAAALLAKEN